MKCALLHRLFDVGDRLARIADVRTAETVHRRVLFGMHELANSNKPYKKSARIVGEVPVNITRTAICLFMIPWCVWRRIFHALYACDDRNSDPSTELCRAMRYTGSALTRLAEDMLRDLDKDYSQLCSEFRRHAEGTSVLPALFEFALNGASASL